MSDFLQFKSFSLYPTIKHAISTKAFGSMKKEDLSIFHANLMKFGSAAGIKSPIIAMQQVHSGKVVIVENNKDLVIPQTDALVTNKKNLPLAVLVADCLPIIFYDPQKKVIGIAHAGYKGIINHIITNTIDCFKTNFGSEPKDLVVGIGPCIEATCYEVGEEVVAQFTKAFGSFQNIYLQKDGKFYLDLRSITKQILMKEGILEEHIEVMDVCTKCNPEIVYSYRGGDKTCRFASVISLV
jgi:YfiH family protein